MLRYAACFFIALVLGTGALGYPSICSVVNTPQSEACHELVITPTTCAFPPRPCAHFSYYAPQYFIEVVSNPGETFFAGLPTTASQLATAKSWIPFAAEDDTENYSFHAHVINVPLGEKLSSSLPCGNTTSNLYCFAAMSEHLGRLWKTGEADLKQPKFLAWSLAPKACIVAGAATSITGGSVSNGYPTQPSCSFDRSWMLNFPPSNQPVCTGWGVNFPRSGTVMSSDQTTASLVVAARIRSLASEVFQSVDTSSNEKWQMIIPQPSSCFREGENIGNFGFKSVSELGRVTQSQPRNYLYVIWKHLSCIREVSDISRVKASMGITRAACRGIP